MSEPTDIGNAGSAVEHVRESIERVARLVQDAQAAQSEALQGCAAAWQEAVAAAIVAKDPVALIAAQNSFMTAALSALSEGRNDVFRSWLSLQSDVSDDWQNQLAEVSRNWQSAVAWPAATSIPDVDALMEGARQTLEQAVQQWTSVALPQASRKA